MLSQEKFYDKDRLLSRLKAKTEVVDGHFLWIGKITSRGRGVMQLGGKFYPRDVEVHRVSAFIHHNLDLDNSNQLSLHKNSCPYKNCWNPKCLYVGDHNDNMRDYRNEDNFRCGHSKAENSKEFSNGTRTCRICVNLRSKNNRQQSTQLPTEKK